MKELSSRELVAEEHYMFEKYGERLKQALEDGLNYTGVFTFISYLGEVTIYEQSKEFPYMVSDTLTFSKWDRHQPIGTEDIYKIIKEAFEESMELRGEKLNGYC